MATAQTKISQRPTAVTAAGMNLVGVQDGVTKQLPVTLLGGAWTPQITALTGGGNEALDGVSTADLDVPALRTIWLGTELQDWLLFTGTDAEDAEAGIVRPDDYAASTNEKVWKRVR